MKAVSSLSTVLFDNAYKRVGLLFLLLLLNLVLTMSLTLGSNGVRDEDSTRITSEQSNRGGADRGADNGANNKVN